MERGGWKYLRQAIALFCLFAEAYEKAKPLGRPAVRALYESLKLSNPQANAWRLVAKSKDLFLSRIEKFRPNPSIVIEFARLEDAYPGSIDRLDREGRLHLTVPEIRDEASRLRDSKIVADADAGNITTDVSPIDPSAETDLTVILTWRCSSVEQLSEVKRGVEDFMLAYNGTAKATNFAAVARRFDPIGKHHS